MPRRLMDDLEGKVVGEEIHEGGFENRLSLRARGFESPILLPKASNGYAQIIYKYHHL